MLDCIIIGQGIAGTFVSYEYYQKNKHFLLIDQYSNTSASRVAAGLFNPISFKRISKVWRADDFFPMLDTYYRKIENFIHEQFYFPIGITKLFNSEFEQNDWIYKADLFSDYISLDDSLKKYNMQVIGGKVNYSGFINTSIFLSGYRKKMLNEEKLIEHQLSYNNIHFFDNYISVIINDKEYQTKKIIFCEGYGIIHNPFFNNLIDLGPTKGEILEIQTQETIEVHTILHKGGFIVPTSKNTFKIGTTYDRDDLTTIPTEKGKEALINIWNDFNITNKYKVISHKAGIRPNTINRKPLMIQHPSIKSLYTCNGLGSRGLSMGPILVNEFFENFINN